MRRKKIIYFSILFYYEMHMNNMEYEKHVILFAVYKLPGQSELSVFAVYELAGAGVLCVCVAWRWLRLMNVEM